MRRRFDFLRITGAFMAAAVLVCGCSLGRFLGDEKSQARKDASKEAKRAIAEEGKAAEAEETAEEAQAALPADVEIAASQEDVKVIEALTMKWCQAYKKKAWGSQWDMLGKASQVRKQFHDSQDSFWSVSDDLVCPLLSCEVRAVRVLKDGQAKSYTKTKWDGCEQIDLEYADPQENTMVLVFMKENGEWKVNKEKYKGLWLLDKIDQPASP